MVSGDAALRLAMLARKRWARATGARVPAASVQNDPWPETIAPDLRDVDVAIARTEPAFEDHPAVHEVETLYLDSIAAARRWIYVENQYFTSGRIADALAARLDEPDGPEIVMVVPRICSGWLEERTMGAVRGRLLHQLRAADRHGRFRVYHPRLPGEGCDLNVHAKVMVVDDALARIGSSNLSNRSMGLDTECDLAIESRGDLRVARAVAGLRNRLLGEHLDTPPQQVATAIQQAGSLIGAVERLAGRPRTLIVLSDEDASPHGVVLTDIAPVDLECPVAHAPFVAWLLPPGVREPLVRGAVRGGRALLGVVCTTLVWRAFGVGAFLASVPMSIGLAAITLTYLLASLLAVPIAALHTVSALALGPGRGAFCASVAALTTDLVWFAAGRFLPRPRVARLAGRHLAPVARLLLHRRARDVAMVRLTGVAPFPTVATVAGASRMPVWRFVLGTMCVTVPSAGATALLAWALGG